MGKKRKKSQDCLTSDNLRTPKRRKKTLKGYESANLAPPPVSPAPSSFTSPCILRVGRQYPSMSSYNGGLGCGERGRTKIGIQGEHVSAYTLYKELIYSVVLGRHIRTNLVEEVLDKFRCLYPDFNENKELKERIEQLRNKVLKVERFFPEEERKAVTETLSSVNSIIPYKRELQTFFKTLSELSEEKRQEMIAVLGGGCVMLFENNQIISRTSEALKGIKKTNPSKVKKAMRDSVRAKTSVLVSEVINIVLSSLNKGHNVTFPVEGNIQNKNTGKEKGARDGLRLLNDLIKDVEEISRLRMENKENNSEERKRTVDKLEEKKEAILGNQRLLEKLSEDFGLKRGGIQKLVNGKNTIDNVLKNCLCKISEKMELLFWYPRIENSNLIDVYDEEWESKKGRYNSGAEPRSNDKEMLYEVAARHVVLIFNCFDGFGKFAEKSRVGIINGFLGKIISKQGWRKEVVSKKSLTSGISKYAVFGCDNNGFSMKGISRNSELVFERVVPSPNLARNKV